MTVLRVLNMKKKEISTFTFFMDTDLDFWLIRTQKKKSDPEKNPDPKQCFIYSR